MRPKSKADLLTLAEKIKADAKKCLEGEISRLKNEVSYLKSVSSARFPGIQNDAESTAADVAATELFNLIQTGRRS